MKQNIIHITIIIIVMKRETAQKREIKQRNKSPSDAQSDSSPPLTDAHTNPKQR